MAQAFADTTSTGLEPKAEIEALETIERIAEERSRKEIAAEAIEARGVLAAGQFNVAVVGQFKRGKSTLINALLGRSLLPSDVAPLTSAITVVQYGPWERCRVVYADGREEDVPLDSIALYASEEGNPGNEKDIRLVVVELPLPLLETGIRLVDTPGVGSVFEPNSETTRSFLSRIDIALVVIGSDPPITGDELALVRAIAPRANRMWFIMNKSDLVPEATRRKAQAFSRRVLTRELGNDPGEFIQASARNSLLTNGADDGVQRVSAMLRDLALHAGKSISRQSAAQAARNLAERLLQQIELERKGLLEPLEKLDEEIRRFNAAMADVEDLMLAAQVRVEKQTTFDWSALAVEKENFIFAESDSIRKSVSAACWSARDSSTRQVREMARTFAEEETRKSAEKWRSLAVARFNRHFEARSRLIADETKRLAARISSAASEAFAVPLTQAPVQRIDIQPELIHFNFIKPALALDLSDWLIALLDFFSSKPAVIRRTCHRIQKLVASWLMQNLYNVDEHLVDWLDKSTRQLAEIMRQRIDGARADILLAVETGRQERDKGRESVSERLMVLENECSRLRGVLSNLSL